MVGVILLLLVALIIRFFNDNIAMNIPLHLLALENVTSLILLVIFVVAGIGWFVHLVLVTPPTETEETEKPDETDDG